MLYAIYMYLIHPPIRHTYTTYLYDIRLRSQQAEQEAAGSAGHQEEVCIHMPYPTLYPYLLLSFNHTLLYPYLYIYVFYSHPLIPLSIYMSVNTLLYTGIYYIGMCDSSAMRSEPP
jgi:hypothetical protein